MGVAGAAGSGAGCEAAGESGLGGGGEGGGLLVAGADPVDAVRGAEGVREAVERVAGDPVDAAHPAQCQCVDDVLCCGDHDALLTDRV